MSKIHELAFNAEEIDELLDSVDKKTIYQDATQSEHGLMSTTDKTKLDAMPTAQQIEGSLSEKVDKVEGKGLSENDYTDAEKGKVSSAYQKPQSGIPKTDLASDVQTSLGKADTAIQEHQDISGKANKDELVIVTGEGGILDGKAIINLKAGTQVTVLTKHQDITGKADKSDTYTKSEVDAKVTSVMRYKGSVNNYAALEAIQNPSVGDVYNVLDTGHNYAYDGTSWDVLSGIVSVDGKADKVSNATNGNFAGLDSNGNLTDSGSNSSDFATASQGAKADTAYQKPQAGIPESDLSPDVQQALQKHFKGWYDSSSNLPANPVVGDYAYVKGAETTDPVAIYECTTAGSWSDSGRTADTSNVQTFESGQEVNETYIDDTHIVNPVAGSLAKAEDVMLFKQQLRGVTLTETKVSIVTSGTGQNTYSDKFLKNDGKIAIPSNTTNTQVNLLIVNVGDAKRVRFLGAQTTASSVSMSYGFAASAPDPTDTTNVQVNVADLKTWDINQDSISAKEYITVDVPDGKPWFVCTIAKYFSSTQVMTLDEFYCYKESGETVLEMTPKVVDNLETEDATKALSANQGHVVDERIKEVEHKFTYTETEYINFDNLPNSSFILQNNSRTILKYIDSSAVWKTSSNYNCNLLKVKSGDKIRLTRGTNGSYIAILKSTDTQSGSAVFVDDENWNSRVASSTITGTTQGGTGTITIPEGGALFYYLVNSNNSPIDTIFEKVNEVTHNGIDEDVDNVEESVEQLRIDVFGGEEDTVVGTFDLTKGKTGTNAYFATGKYKYLSGSANNMSYYYAIDTSGIDTEDDVYIKVTAGEHNCFVTLLSDTSGLSSSGTPNYSKVMQGNANFKILSGQSRSIKLGDDTNYIVFFNKTSTGTDGYYMPSAAAYITKIIYQSKLNINNGWQGITHLEPDNDGQMNVVRRMRKLMDLEWTPAFDLPRYATGGGVSGYEDLFKAGVQYKGIPYARGTKHVNEYGYASGDFKIGINISIETFVTALSNKGTILEYKSVGESEYKHTDSNHWASFYANVCAGSVSAALGTRYISTNEFDDSNGHTLSGFTSIGRISDSFEFTSLKLGDVLAKYGVHTAMITDVIIEDNNVKFIEVSESTTQGNGYYGKKVEVGTITEHYSLVGITDREGGQLGGVGRRLWWTPEQFVLTWNDYNVVRYGKISSVTYIASPYIPMPDEHQGVAKYTMACLPYMGNGFRYVAGTYSEISTMPDKIRKIVVEVEDKDKLHILKKNISNGDFEDYGELITIDYTGYDRETHPYVYVQLPNDMTAGDYEAYVCKYDGETESEKSARCKWSVVDSLTRIDDF